MPKEIVSDLKVFQETSIYLHKNVSIIHDKCNQSLSDANRKLEETQEELAYSKRLLEEAIAEEHRCLLEKIAREEEVAAAAAGLPETAEWYADAMRRLTIAIEEYEKAVAHRILMEQRVALANQCVCIA